MTPLIPLAAALLLGAGAAGGVEVGTTEPLPGAFPPNGLPVLWEADFGQGYSGFAADGDRIYTQGQSLLGQSVLCLDAATGETLWDRRTAHAWDPAGLYPGPRSAPVVHNGRVFYTEPHGTVGCLHAATGKPLWAFDLYERFAAEPVEFGLSCPPVLADGRLYLPVGGADAAMVALDPATGKTLWHSGADQASHCPAICIERDGRPLVLGYLRNALIAFDRETGEQLWREKLSEGYDEHAARPIYREPYLWISGPFRAGSELLELTADPPGVRRVWKSKVLSNDVCSSILVGDSLYGFDLHDVQAKPHRPSRGAFRCVDFLTGETRWTVGTMQARRSAEPEAVGQCSVLSDGERLLMLNDSGELILARATPDRYEEPGRTPLLPGAVVWTAPLLAGGVLYARHQDRAVAVRLTDAPRGDNPGDKRESSTPPDSRTTGDLTPATDWTAAVLPVEPEYMMDAPTRRMLGEWFGVCVALYWAAAVVACGFAGAFGRRSDRPFAARFRLWWPAWAFLSGAAGTTALGHAAGAFLFTWPLAVHAALWATAGVASRPGARRTDDVAAVGLLALFGLYYWLCRRLGLAFEWSFLAGPPAAVPFALLARRLPGEGWKAVVGEIACGTLGFAASYAVGCGLLWWRYG
ncbi:PQQ-binding-like beta-propeller repeat protein [Alienimonas californiensis]|uniref:PQQ-binding-like beta-propeller repeat protein n=1 Tax=Alienimonas californiensis TaxID=2527989 RepID=UPI0013FD0CC5|nr:PQQ-binding-like beta-propeller repeat protein [Alienimonas californiensis]